MPEAAPLMPRKMLPPPTTMQISTPRAWTWATSSAMRSTIFGSMPYSWSPIRASPEIFNSTRRYWAAFAMSSHSLSVADPVFPTSAAERGRHFGREIALLLLDALTEHEADEAGDGDRGADRLGRVLD